MTSKLLKKVSIWDIINKNCTENEKKALINALEYTMRTMGISRKSWYTLEDFYTAKMYGIEQFVLVVERKTTAGVDIYEAEFQHGNKTLKVTASF